MFLFRGAIVGVGVDRDDCDEGVASSQSDAAVDNYSNEFPAPEFEPASSKVTPSSSHSSSAFIRAGMSLGSGLKAWAQNLGSKFGLKIYLGLRAFLQSLVKALVKTGVKL